MSYSTELSRVELALLANFVEHVRRVHSSVMTLRELLSPSKKFTRSELLEGLSHLSERGWIVVSTPVRHPERQTECTLVGGGLVMVQHMLSEQIASSMASS